MTLVRRILVALLFLGLLAVGWRFAASNADLVDIDYLAGSVEAVQLWMALVTAFGLGCILTGCVLMLDVVRTSLLSRRFRKRMNGLEAEVHQLRNLPLEDSPAAIESGSPERGS